MKKINLPTHIGIILDGNGRWAIKHSLPRLAGHEEGAKAIKRMLIASKKFGIKVVSVFAFSTENWKRPKEEVDGIFKILERQIDENFQDFINGGFKLQISGNLDALETPLKTKIEKLLKESENNTKLIFNVCLNYGGRAEIVDACNKIIKSKVKNVDEKTFESFLQSSNLPPLDFVIRTSGEQRISNFMLWQIAYAELYFPNFFWPQFNEKKLVKCLKEYSKRSRRFGGLTQEKK
ncbi:MAG: polyprenyl diphosphate synthase [Christensenellales bacterium]